MAKKTNYTALDDIGFIGVEGDASPRQRIRQAKETAAFIRHFQVGRPHPVPATRTPTHGVSRKKGAAKSTFVTRKRTPSRVAKTVK